ncbi:MAG TPA: hypothetical protein VFT70_14800 [Nocardioides sp.]|nr:hypothetical protein [Nocardioides sp.]
MDTTSSTREQQVIDAARNTRRELSRLEVEQLLRAIEWVELHPGAEVDTSIEWGMRDLEIAGDGAPTIDEGAVAEFALAIGVSTDSGRAFLGEAVELCHRLPTIWGKVLDGTVPVWKARRIAKATICLPVEGAAFVDTALYFVASRCSFAEIERQVEKARREFDPAEAERRRAEAAEHRHVKTHLGFMTSDGLVPITAMADVADAVAFEDYVAAEAAKLDPAIPLPLQVRRSMVLGRLGKDPADGGRGGREVIIYAHTRPDQTMVDVENTRSTITPEQLAEWGRQANTKVTIRPVIDLDTELSTQAYQPTEDMKEQARLRYRECVFPYCHRHTPGTATSTTSSPGPSDPPRPGTSRLCAAATTGSRPTPHGPTPGSPASGSSGPTPTVADIPTDPDPPTTAGGARRTPGGQAGVTRLIT